LKKEGKSVFCDDKVANIGAHRRRSMREDKEKLEVKLFETKKEEKSQRRSVTRIGV